MGCLEPVVHLIVFALNKLHPFGTLMQAQTSPLTASDDVPLKCCTARFSDRYDSNRARLIHYCQISDNLWVFPSHLGVWLLCDPPCIKKAFCSWLIGLKHVSSWSVDSWCICWCIWTLPLLLQIIIIIVVFLFFLDYLDDRQHCRSHKSFSQVHFVGEFLCMLANWFKLFNAYITQYQKVKYFS